MKKKSVLIIIVTIIFTGCSTGFFDLANKGGFNNPTLSDPVPSRPSGEYFLFDLTFDVPSGVVVKYSINSSAVSDYDSIGTTYSDPITINQDSVVSVYQYAVNEVSPVINLTYSMITDVPDAAEITSPTGFGLGKILRWDELFFNAVEWNDALAGRDLDYVLEFDFGADGSSEYAVHNGNVNTVTLTQEQQTQLMINDTTLHMKIVIRDNYGTMIKDSVGITYKYTHAFTVDQTVDCTVLSVSEAGDSFFVSSAGPDPLNSNRIGVHALLINNDYSTNINTRITSNITATVLGISGAYVSGTGAIIFHINDSTDDILYPVFNIISNSSHGSVGSGFTGKEPHMLPVGSQYYLVYMKENTGVNQVILRKYSSTGTVESEEVIIDSLSLIDRLVSFDAGSNGFSIGIEYFNTVKLYKSYLFPVDFAGSEQVINNTGITMNNYSSALNALRCGGVWEENGKYVFRSYLLSESSLESQIDIDLPAVSRPYINGVNEEFYLSYLKEYLGNTEAYLVNVQGSGTKGSIKRVSSNGLDKSFIRIAGNSDQYLFWLEDNDPVICRVF